MTGEKILLIEDNVTLAIGLEACLVANEYQVRHVTNGQEAILACMEIMPDLIITDVWMQLMDGLTFLQHFRNLPDGPDVPFIVISGMSDPESIQNFKDQGIQRILAKPFSLDHFLEIVIEALQG